MNSVVQQARNLMLESKQHHREAVAVLAQNLVKELPQVVLAAARRSESDIEWNMECSQSYKAVKADSYYLLQEREGLIQGDWRVIHNTLTQYIKSHEPEMTFKPFHNNSPQYLVLKWG